MREHFPINTRVEITRSDQYRHKLGVVTGYENHLLVIRLDTGGQVRMARGCVRRVEG